MASENFNQFGPTFQSKVISSLLSDNKFIQTINDILDMSGSRPSLVRIE